MTSVAKKLICTLFAILFAGCGIENINRVNHLHSDGNQKTAQASLDSFEGFANEQTGLATTLLKNLHTQSAHNRGLNELRVGVDETDLTITLTDRTWDGLRFEFYQNLGVTDRAPIPAGGPSTNEFVTWQTAVDTRLKTRYRKVQAVGAVLRALGLGQEALIIQAKENVTRVTDDLERRQQQAAKAAADKQKDISAADKAANKTADDEDAYAQAKAKEFVDLLFKFREAVASAGKAAAETDAKRNQATAVQREILAAVEQSRDAASAYALVAVIGTGLSKDSGNRLNDFLKNLEDRLDAVPLPSPHGNNDADKAWKAFGVAAEEARKLVSAARALDELDQVKSGTSSGEAVAPRLEAVSQKLGALKIQTVKPFQTGVKGAAADQAVVEHVEDLEAAVAARFADGNPMQGLADELDSVGSRISKQIEDFRELIDKLPPALVGKDLTELLGKLKDVKAGDTDSLVDVAFQYLQKALASNPTLLRQMKEIAKDPEAKKRFDAEMAQLGPSLRTSVASRLKRPIACSNSSAIFTASNSTCTRKTSVTIAACPELPRRNSSDGRSSRTSTGATEVSTTTFGRN
ncbi:MAG: hypothetical protein JWL86_3440 [Rhizobium sp.]|nr:hypothetical protein [Rhizobium sp.]